MAGIVFSKSSGLNDSIYGKSEAPIRAFLEQNVKAYEEMSTIKTFLSLNTDCARLAFERNTRTFKRHCVFIGSTNDETFLRDSTSSVERRFWVIKCNKQHMDGKIREVLTKECSEIESKLSQLNI